MFANFDLYFRLAQKIFFILAAVIYLIFATVVVKQTAMMTHNVNDKYNSALVAISYLHLTSSILLVFLTLVLL
jgi:Family of unknown function (DUF5657)